MKSKLTLSINSKILKRAKRTARAKGKSLSKIFEEKMAGPEVPDKKKVALLRLKKLLKEAKPVQALSEQEEQKRKANYLKKKYG